MEGGREGDRAEREGGMEGGREIGQRERGRNGGKRKKCVKERR